MKRVLAVLLAAAMIFALCACGHEHTWVEATCTEPKTCSECGATEGEALGHTWNDATCTEPKTCSVCGATEGEALGHTWDEATCTEPKTCSVCGATEGEALGHDAVWETLSEDHVTATRSVVLRCATCGEELETKEEKIDTFIDGDEFTFTPAEFIERLQIQWDEQNPDLNLKFKYNVTSKGYVNYEICNQNDSVLGFGAFYDVNGDPIVEYAGNVPVASIVMVAGPVSDVELQTLYYLFQELIGPTACTVDPSISSVSRYEDRISNNECTKTDGSPINGLYYSCGFNSDDVYFLLFIDIA